MFLGNSDKNLCILRLKTLKKYEIIDLILNFNETYKQKAKITHFYNLKKQEIILSILNIPQIIFYANAIYGDNIILSDNLEEQDNAFLKIRLDNIQIN